VNFNRRDFIKCCRHLALTSLFFPFLKKAQAQEKHLNIKVLQIYIDLLLPGGEMPGALKLGADKLIINKYENDPTYARAIRLGIAWLNYMSQKLNKTAFSELSLDLQLNIIALSERSDIATLPNLFYLTVRQDVFQYYYGHPEILKYFHYARPPQPLGFMDFTEPPQTSL